ncbi:unnamed protein product [Linum trigynum]
MGRGGGSSASRRGLKQGSWVVGPGERGREESVGDKVMVVFGGEDDVMERVGAGEEVGGGQGIRVLEDGG